MLKIVTPFLITNLTTFQLTKKCLLALIKTGSESEADKCRALLGIGENKTRRNVLNALCLVTKRPTWKSVELAKYQYMYLHHFTQLRVTN